jgi:hypothetical protein
MEGQQQQQQQQQQPVQGNIIEATVTAMQAANGQAGPKKIDYHLNPKMLGKEFTTSELRIWCNRMTFFWDAQLMETRDLQVRWANFFDCMHSSLETYYELKMQRSIGICTARNTGDRQADHWTSLAIMQKDHQTTWPIHNQKTWARLRVCRDLVAVAWVVVAVTWAWGREEDEAPNFLKDSAHVPRETPHVPAGDAPGPAGSTPRAAGGLSSPAGSRLKR